MRYQNFLVLFSLMTFMVLAYQNCGKSGFYAQLDSESSFSSLSSRQFSQDMGLITAKFAGTFDTNCLNNPVFDACLFWKNPVASRGGPYPSMLEFGTTLDNEQNFGVELKNLTNPRSLISKSLNVFYSGSDINGENRLVLSNGQFRQSYAADGNAVAVSDKARSTSQLMAYFWLDHLETEMKRRTGTSYSENVLTHVDAFSTDPAYDTLLKGNAFFTFSGSTATGYNRFIILGYSPMVKNNQVVKAHEMALSAEVYIHEMGHGNFFAAKGNDASGVAFDDNATTYYRITACSDITYRTDPAKNVGIQSATKIAELEKICDPTGNGNFKYNLVQACNSNQGCFGAINEGQADFHYMMVFPDSLALGETVENNNAGFKMGPIYSRQNVGGNSYKCIAALPDTEIFRNVDANRNKTMEQFFQASTIQFNNCSNEIPGEIHGMGSAYATLLWEIYSSGKIDARLFEKAFQSHLQKINRSSDFAGAWMALRADYLAVGGNAEGQAIIDGVFARKGVVKPALF